MSPSTNSGEGQNELSTIYEACFRTDCDALTLRGYLQQHPDENLAAVARRFGVSRQRVHQLARRLGIPKREPSTEHVRVCPDCGDRRVIRVRYALAETLRRCRSCAAKARMSPPVDVRCTYCGETFALVGIKRTDYLQQQKAGKSFRLLCPACVPLIRR